MKEGLPGTIEMLAPRIAVGPLGDARHRQVGQAEIGEHAARRRELALAAVDQHQIGPGPAPRPPRLVALSLLLEQPGETPGQHFAHHAEIVRA